MFDFSIVPVPGIEIDSLAPCGSTDNGGLTIKFACTTRDQQLLSVIIHKNETQQNLATVEWSREMKSRSWSVVCAPECKETSRSPSIFVGREDGAFHAYMVDGTPAWSHKFQATISEFDLFEEPDIDKRFLLVPSLDKTLRLLDAMTGKLVWGDTFQSGVNVACHGTGLDLPDKSSSALVAGGNDFTLRFYTRAKNDQAAKYAMSWFHKFGSYVRDVDISTSGIVAGVADDGFLKILDATKGGVLWAYEHESFAWKCKILEAEDLVISSSYQVPIAVDESGDKLGNPGCITCHCLSDGRLLWRTTREQDVNVNTWDFACVNGQWQCAVGTTWGKIIVLDVRTGNVESSFHVGHLINQVKFIGVDENGMQKSKSILALLACQEKEGESLILGVAHGL